MDNFKKPNQIQPSGLGKPPRPLTASDFKKKGKPGLIITIIIVILLIVIGTGIVLATRIWDPIWNPFRPSPEKVLKQMFIEMEKVKTSHTNGELNLRIEDKTGPTLFPYLFVSMIFEVDSDITDLKNIKSKTKFDLTASDEESDQKISLVGEFRSIGQDSYFNLSKIDFGEIGLFFAMFGLDMSKIENQWVKSAQSSQDLNLEEQERFIEKVKEIFLEHNIYYVKKELKDEKVNGIKTYHYLLSLNNEELTKAISEVYFETIQSFYNFDEIGTMSPDFSESAVKGALESSLNEFFEKVGDMNIDLWIGKKDKLVYKVDFEKEIDVSQILESAQGEIDIQFQVENSNFNEPVNIEAPKDYKELKDIMPMFGPSLTPSYPVYPSKNPYQYQYPYQDQSDLFQASIFQAFKQFLIR